MNQDLQENEIRFTINNGAIEIIRFDSNGDIFIKGKLVTNDMEVVDGIREFLIQSGAIKR